MQLAKQRHRAAEVKASREEVHPPAHARRAWRYSASPRSRYPAAPSPPPDPWSIALPTPAPPGAEARTRPTRTVMRKDPKACIEEDNRMETRGETLAKQFEQKVQEALAVVEPLSDVDWKKMTMAEHWPVGVTAHHLANAFEVVPGVITAIVSGHPRGGFTRAMLDQGNAHHAQEHANCTKAETVALLKKGGTAATAIIRALTDDQLSKSAPVFTDAPPMTAEQLIQGALIHHVDEHIGSIRKTVGH